MSADRKRIEVQVLGSGGPMHAGGRGSAAYLLWRGQQPLLALDMGGDTPMAMAEAGVGPAQLPLLVISHLHPDHVSGIPDFVWGEVTAGRSEPLLIIGPPSEGRFRDACQLFHKLFSEEGVFPDLADLMAGKPFPVRFIEARSDGGATDAGGGLTIRSMRVNHGDVPALAFRIEVDAHSIVFAGDQTMDDPAFVSFASGADLMIAHAIATEAAASTPLGSTVAIPSRIGAAARGSGVGRLVLGHWLGLPASSTDAALWSLADVDGVVAAIKRAFGGEVVVASDLDRYAVGE